MTQPQAQEPEIDFTHYLDVVLRRRWIVLSLLGVVLTATTLVTFTTRPVYQASALLLIEKERGSSSPYASGALESSNDDYYQTQYKLLQSLSLARKVYGELGLGLTEDFEDPNGLEKLQKAVHISPVLRSRLVYVRAESHDPSLAARISNAVVEAFVSQNLANQLFISKEVLQALQLKPEDPESRRTYEALPAVVNNPLIQTLKGEHAKLEAQAAEMSQRFTAKYPAMIALRSNMAALKGQIQAETDKIVTSLKTELSGQLKGNNVRVVDPAQVPDKPVRPRKLTALLLGLLGGLAAGLAGAFLVETLDQSVRTQEDVENKLHLPFLGLIPASPQRDAPSHESLLASEPSLTSEAVRNLRTMIDFAGVGEKARAMVVTSTVQAEGKTHVASNLAVAFAQMGERVLLIDGDLRRPRVHKSFGLSGERGLSDFLASGKSVSELDGLLQQTLVPGLAAIVCGPRPPNPSELLNTPRLGALVSWAKEKFDRIVVDCTPIFPINDAMLWSRHVPAGVFIVRYGLTRVPLIANACQRLQGGGMNILGVVVNSARPGGLAYAAYGYHYQQYYHSYAQQAAATKAS